MVRRCGAWYTHGMGNYIGLYLLISGGLILTVGDIIMRFWVKDRRPLLYVAGLFFYIIGLNFLAQSYRFRNIAVASAVIVIINIVALTVVSWVYFKARLTPLEILGLVLAVVAVVILESGK